MVGIMLYLFLFCQLLGYYKLADVIAVEEIHFAPAWIAHC